MSWYIRGSHVTDEHPTAEHFAQAHSMLAPKAAQDLYSRLSAQGRMNYDPDHDVSFPDSETGHISSARTSIYNHYPSPSDRHHMDKWYRENGYK